MERSHFAWLILAVSALLGGLPAARGQGLDCHPIDALNAGRWAQAEVLLRRSLARGACAMFTSDLRFSLAHVLERRAADDPARACEARDIYRAVVTELKQDDIREAAVQGAQRTGRTCECLPPAELREAGRWSEAEALARARLAEPACAPFAEALRFELALVIEQDAGTIPMRACEALQLYEAIAEDPASDRAHVARVNASRMRIICDSARARELADQAAAEAAARPIVEICSAAGDEDGNGLADCADPACTDGAHCVAEREGHRNLWLGLTVAAGVTAVAGGSLLFTGTQFDAERAEARSDYVSAHGRGEPDAFDDAADRWASARARATAFGVSGWVALATAAGLGTAAAVIWRRGPDLSVTVSPTGADVSLRF